MTTSQTFKNTCVILLTLLAAYTLVASIRIIVVLLIAIIIASAMRPIVDAMTRRRIPIGIAILLVYVALALILGVIFVAALPPVVSQVTLYFENEGRLAYRIILAQRWIESSLGNVLNEEVTLVDPVQIRDAVSVFIQQIRDGMPSFLDNISSSIGEAILIFVIGAYWLTSHEKAARFVQQLAPPSYRDNVQRVINDIETTLGSYVRGVFLVSLISGVLNFGLLQLLSVPNALTIGLTTAITTTIPMIGGLIGLIAAVLITLVSEPQYLVIVLVVCFGVQQLESYVFAPRIMSNSVGLDPLLVILYTSIGFVLFGIIGALIAVPIMGVIHILLVNLIVEPHRESIQTFKMEGGLPVMRSVSDETIIVSSTD